VLSFSDDWSTKEADMHGHMWPRLWALDMCHPLDHQGAGCNCFPNHGSSQHPGKMWPGRYASAVGLWTEHGYAVEKINLPPIVSGCLTSTGTSIGRRSKESC
jgi:hypothetical protein